MDYVSTDMASAWPSDMKVGAGLDGQMWDLREDNPVPAGYLIDSSNRLHRIGSGRTPAASSLSHEDFGPSADQLLASAKAAGWRPGGNGVLAGGLYDGGGNLCCGVCIPCRNGSRNDCIDKNSATAKANATERARMRATAETEDMLRSYGTASGISLVDTQDEATERGRRLAMMRDRYGL